ncbi:glycosyltransferase [Paenibacillus sedimenti]|uniref:Glycosyl transferase n=1 Tax=Paenibacillus sedimenti TaxID=2770274 RepID=A0A926QHM0_9BACL|nr:glycosyltransferase [Paenibacillus sedimenti]MBD0379691.1 hypothetical protein [Paenibacillus sedimenti]
MIISTSICANYLPKAFVLGNSIKKHIKDAKFVICLVESEMPEEAIQGVNDGYADAVVLGKHLGIDHGFNSFMFKHTIVEASTSVKGFLFKHLFNAYPDENKFLYFDPDTKVYDDITELRDLLDRRPIVLCPHLLHPGHIEMEISSIKYGVYNLGFLAVNRSEEAMKFIDWWADRLFHYCYDELSNGLFTDQRWVDLAPTFFDVELLRHYGYDFGTWALKSVQITKESNLYYINGDPLKLAHFSGYDSGTIDMVQRWWVKGETATLYKEMVDEYTRELEDCGSKQLSKLKWSYGYYKNGQPVSKEIRISYRNENKLRWEIDDPYLYSDEILAKKLNVTYGKDYPKWASYTVKAINMTVNYGFTYLFKKIIKKLVRL